MPNSCRISWARRGPVHSSVANPCFVGSSVNQRRMIFSCVVVSLAGRPGTGRANNPASPSHRNRSSQRRTVRGSTSRNSATSAAEYPSRSRRMARRRRCSSSSGEPWVLIRFPGILCPLHDVGSIADILEVLFIFQTNLAHAPYRLVFQVLIVPVWSIGPVMCSQEVPHVLHRVQLRRIRRQQDQAHIA